MVDTPRTRAQLLALFPDNHVGAITPLNARDFIVSAILQGPTETGVQQLGIGQQRGPAYIADTLKIYSGTTTTPKTADLGVTVEIVRVETVADADANSVFTSALTTYIEAIDSYDQPSSITALAYKLGSGANGSQVASALGHDRDVIALQGSAFIYCGQGVGYGTYTEAHARNGSGGISIQTGLFNEAANGVDPGTPDAFSTTVFNKFVGLDVVSNLGRAAVGYQLRGDFDVGLGVVASTSFSKIGTAFIHDASDSPTSYKAGGSHTNGIDFTGGTFTGAAFKTTTGAIVLGAALVPAQITGHQNNYAPTGHAAAFLFRLNASAPWNITGIAGGTPGRIILLKNTSGNTITLTSEDAASTAANRLGVNAISLTANTTVALYYDGTASRWCAWGGVA